MKKIFVLSPILISVFMIFLFSCENNNGNQRNDSLKRDTTIYDRTRPAGNNYLEDLLNIKDEADLKMKYPNEKISYDTIWGAEGNFNMGTFMDEKERNEVQITWKDSLHRSGIANVMIISKTDSLGNYIYNNDWISKTGIKLGMTTDELEKINRRSFSFSGFGWDYGGGVGDWKKGTLENSGISLTIDEGNSWSALSEKDRNQIMGDQTVMSDNPIIKKIQPRVVMILIWKAQ